MIGFDEAVGLIGQVAQPSGSEQVPLIAAHTRVLAQEVTAEVGAPRADVSAMDGYAARDADLAVLPARLKVAGESFPANGHEGRLGEGECIRIFTGAPVPAGADRVVIQEVVRREGEVAIIGEHPGGARHIRRRGSDFEKGDALLEPGRMIDARALVAAAGADLAELIVWRKPRIFILATGDELADPGRARALPNAVPESVSFGVAALAEEWGGTIAGRRRLRDELAPMVAAAGEALEMADLVVVTGGASVGERDFAKAMFEPHGLALSFSKVAIKPGKPVWLGRARGRLVLGLPGNPTSAMVTARLLLAPLVAGLAGRGGALAWRTVQLAAPLPACGERETFHRARLEGGKAVPLANQDSSAQKSLAAADLLLRSRPHDPARAVGSEVEALDL